MRQRRESGDGRLDVIELIDRVLRDPVRTNAACQLVRTVALAIALLLALILLAASHTGIACAGGGVSAAAGLVWAGHRQRRRARVRPRDSKPFSSRVATHTLNGASGISTPCRLVG